MKIRCFYGLLMCFLLGMVVTGCSKDDENEADGEVIVHAGKLVSRIIVMGDNDDGDAPLLIRFEYDENNRIIEVYRVNTDDLNDGVSYNYEYGGNQIIETRKEGSDYWYCSMIYILNDKGLIATAYDGDGDDEVRSFFYDSNNQLIKLDNYGGRNYDYIEEYVWENGNVTKYSRNDNYSRGDDFSRYQYKYQDQVNKSNIDFRTLINDDMDYYKFPGSLAISAYYGAKSAKLCESLTGGDDDGETYALYTYKYEFSGEYVKKIEVFSPRYDDEERLAYTFLIEYK